MDNGGAILTYLVIYLLIEIPPPTGYQYYQLPYLFSNNCQMEFSIQATGGNHYLTINYRSIFEDALLSFSSNCFVRYILVPGVVYLRISSPPPNTKNYKVTCEYYRIPE